MYIFVYIPKMNTVDNKKTSTKHTHYETKKIVTFLQMIIYVDDLKHLHPLRSIF